MTEITRQKICVSLGDHYRKGVAKQRTMLLQPDEEHGLMPKSASTSLYKLVESNLEKLMAKDALQKHNIHIYCKKANKLIDKEQIFDVNLRLSKAATNVKYK